MVIHKPSTKKGYYGADVTGPVFKRIAQKIYTDSPLIDRVKEVEIPLPEITSDFEQYHDQLQKNHEVVPNVVGMEGMDAVSLLENLGMNVITKGQGEVKQQSLRSGEQIKKGRKIVLNLS